MISGDSTASHIGNAKNIEKARERRTFEIMPGSAATGIPEELQEHAQTIHPRMGYDMSDSLFMQQQEAAAIDKESKRALEERTALEAFRAAALQKPFDPAAAGLSRAAGDAGAAGGAAGDSKQKQPPALGPAPLVGIKLRKKASRSEASSSSSPGATTGTAASGQAVGGDDPGAGSASKRSAEDGGEGSAKKKEHGGSGGSSGSASKKSKKKKSSKKSKTGRHSGRDAATEGGGGAEAPAAAPTAGVGLGLVAYSSGEDDEEET